MVACVPILQPSRFTRVYHPVSRIVTAAATQNQAVTRSATRNKFSTVFERPELVKGFCRGFVPTNDRRDFSAAAESSTTAYPQCKACGFAPDAPAFSCKNCAALLPVDTIDERTTHYSILGLQPAFEIDLEEVDEAYKALQRNFHPDRHAHSGSEQISLAEAHSARLNEAVRVLRSPLRRARYWMKLKGVQVLEEDQRMEDMATMMEVMEISEEIDEAETKEDIDTVARNIQALLKESEEALIEPLRREDWHAARTGVERLQMLTRLWERVGDRRV
eukprot:TRINITY_DN51570_c0_g1_i1.p1 TRINITY_DN51570_c0_g1~~TRINITY_DN51570_c0_g1_i1.p1  ORF type:complete len:276 (+),score=38.10 TRINITY_DN51570_c0_g1_i1:120-947(+)